MIQQEVVKLLIPSVAGRYPRAKLGVIENKLNGKESGEDIIT
jgi:hypothetical protein